MIKNDGFTLIELLVVIGIISMLSSIVLFSTSNVRQKAEDTRRLSDMRQIVNALELYNLQHGQYPDSDNECVGGWDSSSDGDFLHILTEEGFLPRDFLDPSVNNNNSNCGNYQYHRYIPGTYGCNNTHFYVLEIIDMQSTPGFPGNGGTAFPGSPGWKCAGRDWNTYAEWVTGNYE